MRVAVVGCSHGSLDDIYASVANCTTEALAKGEPAVDLMLCCGDFQAMRGMADLEMMACPVKYRALGQFHNYYAGRAVAPMLTIVIGGNHESSGYMWETYHGGWLAPNVYFLGYAGCVLVDGWLRIAGSSGIWKSGDWKRGHYETVPYDEKTIRSVYHVREYDIARLLQLKSRGTAPDIFMSHDWPLSIEQHGDTEALLREKPFFRSDIEGNCLGSPPLHALLTTIKPSYWFSAHLHVRFAALFHHSGTKTVVKKRIYGRPPVIAPAAANPDEINLEDDEEDVAGGNPEEIEMGSDEDDGEDGEVAALLMKKEAVADLCACEGNPEEIDLEMDADEDEAVAPIDAVEAPKIPEVVQDDVPKTTKFLALGKPGHGKDFLQILDFPTPSSYITTPLTAPKLFFDPHWLSIVRTFAPYLSVSRNPIPFPHPSKFDSLISESLDWVKANVGKGGDGLLGVDEVQVFAKTAPGTGEGMDNAPLSWYTNPQTEAFCAMLGIPNKINPVPEGFKEAQAAAKLVEEEMRVKREAEEKIELERMKKEALEELDRVEVE